MKETKECLVHFWQTSSTAYCFFFVESNPHATSHLENNQRVLNTWGTNFSCRPGVPSSPWLARLVPATGSCVAVHCTRVRARIWLVLGQQPDDALAACSRSR